MNFENFASVYIPKDNLQIYFSLEGKTKTSLNPNNPDKSTRCAFIYTDYTRTNNINNLQKPITAQG